MADITAEILASRLEEIERLKLYPRINELPVVLLDILAYDFKVDWWDRNYTLDEKRRTLADSWRVHKTLGTKAAVETAIRAIYPKAEVQEWFEYGGKPYYFRLLIDMTDEDPDPARRDRALQRVNFYKNLRSHVDSIEYTVNMGTMPLHIGGLASLVVRLPIPEQPDNLDFRGEVHAGGQFTSVVKLPIPEAPDCFDFQGGLQMGGISGTTVRLPIPEQRDALNFRSETRMGGGMAFHVRLPTVQYYAAEPPEGG